jgi:uncharacterized membrane protein HdeD (DUF308 family)
MATEGAGVKAAKRFTRWYIVAAILFIVLGVFAILEPAMAGLGVALLVGWLLVFGGIAHFISAFEGGGVRRVFLQVLAGIVFVLGGLYMLAHPLLALGTLTLMLAGVIFAVGICELLHWYRHRGEAASGWLLFNAIVTLLLGGLILFHWPSSSIWAIGTLVGVNLLLTGISRLMFGLAGRRLLGRVAA